MQKCLLVVNKSSGNFERFNSEIAGDLLGGEYSVEFADIDDDYLSRIKKESLPFGVFNEQTGITQSNM